MSAQGSITVIGGGLAGSEAAWQAAARGAEVDLYEMRPVRQTPAHQTDRLGEIVCSNSLKTDEPATAPYLLKEELRRAGSLLLEIAQQCRVPAGSALAVDREKFSKLVTDRVSNHPRIHLHREEVAEIDPERVTVIATGPLTSEALAGSIRSLTDSTQLYFYDAISPIVEAETIDREIAFAAARYGKGGDDYLNCPFTEEEYHRFYDHLIAAESAPLHAFEQTRYFEACLPIEEMARRGRDTLRFGPMKPVGLIDPRTGKQPWAVVQLRVENLLSESYNLVGFQNHLKFGDQKRIFRMIPGLESAEFIRFGQIHRNTYINSPSLLDPTLGMKRYPRVFFAGQICGVEGYVESIATGLIAGVNASLTAAGREPLCAPRSTATGSLLHYITHADPANFQPVNITFALLPPLEAAGERRIKNKALRHQRQVEKALNEFEEWFAPLRAGRPAVAQGGIGSEA